jgi:hypothetical protein
MRLEPRALPDAGDHGVTDFEMTRQTPGAPMGHSILRPGPGRFENPSFQGWRAPQRLASTMPGIAARQPLGQKATFLPRHILASATQATLWKRYVCARFSVNRTRC